MPWGTIIITAFLFGGAALGIQHIIVGTTATDEFVRNIVPIGLGGVFVAITAFSIFS